MTPTAADVPLCPRQERFCRAYVANPNATRAAIRAGYSRRSAASQGSRLLTRPDVRARLQVLSRDLADRACGDKDALLVKLEAVFLRSLEDHNYVAAGKAVEAQARLVERWRALAPAEAPAEVPAKALAEARMDGGGEIENDEK